MSHVHVFRSVLRGGGVVPPMLGPPRRLAGAEVLQVRGVPVGLQRGRACGLALLARGIDELGARAQLVQQRAGSDLRGGRGDAGWSASVTGLRGRRMIIPGAEERVRGRDRAAGQRVRGPG